MTAVRKHFETLAPIRSLSFDKNDPHVAYIQFRSREDAEYVKEAGATSLDGATIALEWHSGRAGAIGSRSGSGSTASRGAGSSTTAAASNDGEEDLVGEEEDVDDDDEYVVDDDNDPVGEKSWKR